MNRCLQRVVRARVSRTGTRALHALALSLVVLVAATVLVPPEGSALVATGEKPSVDGDFERYEVADLLVDFDRLHPDVVATVSVDLSLMGSVAEELLVAKADQDDADLRLRVATSRRSTLRREIATTAEELRAALIVKDQVAQAESTAEDNVAQLAVLTFVVVEDASLDGFGRGVEGNSLETVAADSQQRLAERLLVANAKRRVADRIVLNLGSRLERLTVREQGQRLIAETAGLDLDSATVAVAQLQTKFERNLMTMTVLGTDFPVVAFDAYYRAQISTAQDNPACEVSWNQLAGIGKVESSHGSFGGNVVGLDGRTDGEILGPVLNGEEFSAIADTDGGLLDGDIEWDRAVGPMQFIPGSWSMYGRDGNGDGQKDPHNLYDAALAAAAHLCGSTTGLSEQSNFQYSLLGYNQSAPYGVEVMRLAEEYLEEVGDVALLLEQQAEEFVVSEFR